MAPLESTRPSFTTSRALLNTAGGSFWSELQQPRAHPHHIRSALGGAAGIAPSHVLASGLSPSGSCRSRGVTIAGISPPSSPWGDRFKRRAFGVSRNEGLLEPSTAGGMRTNLCCRAVHPQGSRWKLPSDAPVQREPVPVHEQAGERQRPVASLQQAKRRTSSFNTESHPSSSRLPSAGRGAGRHASVLAAPGHVRASPRGSRRPRQGPREPAGARGAAASCPAAGTLARQHARLERAWKAEGSVLKSSEEMQFLENSGDASASSQLD